MTYLTYDRDFNVCKIDEPKAIEILNKIKKLHRHANSIARQHGYGFATSIQLGTADVVLANVQFGYRKKTTNEYVSNAYRNNFGWKNTYYQHAECLVEIKVF
jgi:hypothetical protein